MAEKTNKTVADQTTVNEDSNGTPAADSLKPNSKPGDSNPPTKTAMMAQLLSVMGGLSNSDLVDFFNKSLALIGKEADQLPSGASAEHNRASVAMKGSAKEDFNNILSGDELSEDFRTRTATLFEAAIEGRILAETEILREEYAAALEESTKKIHEELTTNFNAYADYVVENWIKTNTQTLTSTLKLEVMEEFIEGMKSLFIEHYIDIPEGKVQVVEQLTDKVDSLEGKLSDAIVNITNLKEELDLAQRATIINEEAIGLPLTQVEKFKKLAENIDSDGSLETFRTKLRTIRESHKTPNVKPTTTNKHNLTEDLDGVADVEDENNESKNKYSKEAPEMQAILAALKSTR